MKGLKKALALFLAMLMILAVSPMAAFADDEEETEPDLGPEAAWFTAFGIWRGEGTLAEAAANVQTTGTISVLRDVEALDETIAFTKNVTVKGNGYTITRAPEFTGNMFTVDQAKVELTQLTVSGNASDENQTVSESLIKIISGSVILEDGTKLTDNNAAGSNGGAVTVGTDGATTNKTFTMKEGSEISNCTAANGGAVMLYNRAVFDLDGGVITNCTASANGGAVDVARSGAEFTITSGKITDCTAAGLGGAVLVESNASASLIGGSISGNTNKGTNTGAVHVATGAQSFTVGGGIYVFDNTNANSTRGNIYTANNVKVIINPDFLTGAKVGLRTAGGFQTGDDLSDIITMDYGTDIAGYIFSDLDGKTFNEAEDGTLDLRDTITVTFNPGNGTCSVKSKVYCVGLAFGYLPDPDEREDFEFLGWYLTNDVQITEDTIVEFSNNITLNAKWRNLYEQDNGPFAIIGRFFERIGDLMRMVFDFLQSLFTGTGDRDLGNLK